jgi:hypothetical protein
MTLEQALELNGQLARFLLAQTLGETATTTLPTEVTLAEWLQATGMAKAENQRLAALAAGPDGFRQGIVHVDARGVAAAYVLTHYQGDPLPHPEVVLVAAGKALLLATLPAKPGARSRELPSKEQGARSTEPDGPAPRS